MRTRTAATNCAVTPVERSSEHPGEPPQDAAGDVGVAVSILKEEEASLGPPGVTGPAAALALVSVRPQRHSHTDTQHRPHTLTLGLHTPSPLHSDDHTRPYTTHAINTLHCCATDHKRHTTTPSRAHRPFACFVFTRRGGWQRCVSAYVSALK
ncbi:hypothetical protein Pmani_035376 [Petrolisthes manimaculis]|uniref:Uncharacterized protein n=1 Tax=Petrolisthes manimaculis TaxID=1843537 RepID=A0AAE1NLU5_9EUCA|nr:hypothetical protein Pmani_035376 [Petrolisthes manimaculis]